MIKQISILLCLSFIVIFFLQQFSYAVHYLIHWHALLMAAMGKIFAGGNIGILIRNLTALTLLPLGIAFIPYSIAKIVAHREFTYFYHVLWASWIILCMIIIIKIL